MLLLNFWPFGDSNYYIYPRRAAIKVVTTLGLLLRGVARGEGGQGGQCPRILADQLTLFKPGGQIMPLTLLPATWHFLNMIFQPLFDLVHKV
jgi:hypothetical protein